jgi:hypothetical protein
MDNKEINQIIENYKPHQGFFDLSVKPKTLNKIEYAKILNTQNILVEQGNNIEYLKKFTPIQYEDWKEISAIYQAIVYQYWGI